MSLPTRDRKFNNRRTDKSEPIKAGFKRILFVDDEEVIVSTAQQMLERRGYRVTPCMGSVEALETFSINPDSFDLIVTDMDMPNMAGVQLSREVKNIRSDIPAILCTGFSHQVSDEKIKDLEIPGVVTKPMTMKEFDEAIRKVLDYSQAEGG